MSPRLITLTEGAIAEGFFLRTSPDLTELHLRGSNEDIAVPLVSQLRHLVLNLHLLGSKPQRLRKLWFRIEFVRRERLPDSRVLWSINVTSERPPHGLRGALRRQGRRL